MKTVDSRRPESASPRTIGVDHPAVYTIRVVGKLNEQWSERLNGLTILSYNTILTNGLEVTTLTGTLQDQTALAGTLSTLHNLQLPLLSAVQDRSNPLLNIHLHQSLSPNSIRKLNLLLLNPGYHLTS